MFRWSSGCVGLSSFFSSASRLASSASCSSSSSLARALISGSESSSRARLSSIWALDRAVPPVGLHPVAQAAELLIQLREAPRVGSHLRLPELLLELLVARQNPLHLFKHTRRPRSVCGAAELRWQWLGRRAVLCDGRGKTPRRSVLLGVAAPKTLHLPCRIHDLLLPGEEGMAARADLDPDFLLRGACRELVPARTTNLCVAIRRMNIRLHGAAERSPGPPLVQWDPAAGGRGHPPPLRPTAFAARAAFRGACMGAKPPRRLPVLHGI